MLSLVPNMARHVSTALAVLASALALLAFANVGQAQLTITLNAVQGRDVSTRPLTSPYAFSAADCTGSKTLDLTISNFPTVAPVLPTPLRLPTMLDFWSGTGCNDATIRTSATSTACTHLFSKPSIVGPTVQLLDITVDQLGGCIATADGTAVNVYALAATADHTTEVVGSFGTLATTFDLVAPAPPTAVTGGSGNTAVPVSWTATTGTINGYRVYIGSVTTSAEGGACDPGGLVAGEVPPAGARLVASAANTATSTTLDLAALGLAVGESVSVGIVARDAALNEGVLSTLACVTRVETCGYLCQRGGTVSTCSAVPGARRTGGATSAGLLAVAAVALLLHARRDRRAR